MVLDSQDGVHLVENGMSKALPNLADLPPDVQAYIAAQTAALVAERIAHSLAIQNRDTIITDLRLQLDGHKKHRFGSRSESLDQLALELMLEEHEIAQAADVEQEARLPRTKYALPAYYIIAPAEASSNLARYDSMRYGLRVDGDNPIDTYEKTRAEGFGAEVRRRVMIGAYVLSAGYYDAYYIKAQQVRKLIADEFSAAFETVDAILTPTVPSAAFAHGEKSDDLIAMYLNDVLTVPASLAGLPAISVPASLSSEGLPLGLHLITNAFDEETLFRAAEVLELAANFTARPGDQTA